MTHISIGQQFGKLTAVEEASGNSSKCCCQCECGAIKKYNVKNLLRGNTKSCGCSRKTPWNSRDLRGKRFGRLTVIGNSFREGDHRRWPCLCDCGNELSVKTAKLINGHTQSCGCKQRDSVVKKNHESTKRSDAYWFLYAAKRRAIQKGLEFTLSENDLGIVIPSRCPLLDIPIFRSKGGFSPNSPSLDRIDSAKGYIPGNVWVISNRANLIKRDATAEELNLLVTNFNRLQRERLSEKTPRVGDATVRSCGNTTARASNGLSETTSNNQESEHLSICPERVRPFSSPLGAVKPSLIDSNAEMPTRRKAESSCRERLSEKAPEKVMQQSDPIENKLWELDRNDLACYLWQ